MLKVERDFLRYAFTNHFNEPQHYCRIYTASIGPAKLVRIYKLIIQNAMRFMHDFEKLADNNNAISWRHLQSMWIRSRCLCYLPHSIVLFQLDRAGLTKMENMCRLYEAIRGYEEAGMVDFCNSFIEPIRSMLYPFTEDHTLIKHWVALRIKSYSPGGSLKNISTVFQLHDIFGIHSYLSLRNFSRDHLGSILRILDWSNICDAEVYIEYLQGCKNNCIINEDFDITQIQFDADIFTNQMLLALCALYLNCLGDGMSGLVLELAADIDECPWANPGPDYQHEIKRIY